MRALCRRLGVDETGRPYCAHGPMYKNGLTKAGAIHWVCRSKRNEHVGRYYEANALKVLMRTNLRHHRRRLAQLNHQTEGE